MRRISIFGATGSIGQNTLDLIARAPNTYQVVALTGGGNIAQLARDAIAHRAQVAVTAYEDRLSDLQDALAGTGIEAAAGEAALIEAAARPADWVMSAIVGAAGIAPGFAALEQGATLALANKESLVAAGQLLLSTAATHGADILPVDSEHSAVFQALLGEEVAQVERVIITASGGGLRDWPIEKLADATPQDAGAHPNWDMGQRITIDSASMFNKALELIETREYFGFNPNQIEAVIHPQSLIHALVGFCDGALMAHLGPPDMRHAIGFALHYPKRASLPVARLDLAQIGALQFEAPDDARFPALRLARDVMEMRGGAGAVFNAAKEIALDGFLAREIGFMQMSVVVEETLSRIAQEVSLSNPLESLADVRGMNHLARVRAREVMARVSQMRR
ncbi:1-deoxy-D-xylulose-5-phosphate reductoisomerase [Rhodobacteraceae bacterium XHP0102]|nr:1-deoxy-D-xylulose-5-phosphate reductoisomerase [Rhodobacteraceae bacterium XHP0102]